MTIKRKKNIYKDCFVSGGTITLIPSYSYPFRELYLVFCGRGTTQTCVFGTNFFQVWDASLPRTGKVFKFRGRYHVTNKLTAISNYLYQLQKKATNEMTVYLPDYSIYSNKRLIVGGSNVLQCYSEMLNKEHTGHVFAFQVPESHHILFIYLTSLRFGRHYVQLLGRFENIPERRTDKKRWGIAIRTSHCIPMGLNPKAQRFLK